MLNESGAELSFSLWSLDVCDEVRTLQWRVNRLGTQQP